MVLWEWSRGDDENPIRQSAPRERSVVRDAFGAAALLGVILLVLSWIPDRGAGSYRRDRLGAYMCAVAGAERGTASCFAVAIGGWFAIVVSVGIALKAGRGAWQAVTAGRTEP